MFPEPPPNNRDLPLSPLSYRSSLSPRLEAKTDFDQEGNMVNEAGEIIAESRVVAEYLSNLQRASQGMYTAGGDFSGMPRPRASPRGNGGMLPRSASAQPRFVANHHHSQLHAHAEVGVGLHDTTNTLANHPHAAAGGAGNTYPAAPAAYDPPSAPPPAANNSWLPQDNGFAHLYTTAAADDVATWNSQQYQQQHQQQQAVQAQANAAFVLPPRRSPAPSIRLTTTPTYPSQPPQDSLSVYHSATTPDQYFHYGGLSPRSAALGMPEQAAQSEMQRTPPRSPHHHQHQHHHQHPLEQQPNPNPRKRSYSTMSAGHARSRDGSVISNAENSLPEDDYPSTRAFKRDDPPMNPDNKYICTYSPECAALTFDRKCEWSKHMDKHDRPYRCPHPQCAKLQGFTYSGGLLRHEREVHNKHGGPKAQLMCPHEDCKRHSGKGFTRKENLNEHMRRVHKQGTSPGEGEVFAAADGEDDNISPALKRRRYDGVSVAGEVEEEDLLAEVQRLREEVVARDARVAELMVRLEDERRDRESEVAGLREAVRTLEEQARSAR